MKTKSLFTQLRKKKKNKLNSSLLPQVWYIFTKITLASRVVVAT